MSADILAAMRQMLLDDIVIEDIVDGRIWNNELDRAEIAHWSDNEIRKCIVISLGGAVPSAGSNSYVKVKRMRLDFRMYGEDDYEARQVWLLLDAFMKAIRAATVDLVDGGVHIDNAVESSGPLASKDPDTDWPFVVVTWSVHYSEVVVETALVSS